MGLRLLLGITLLSLVVVLASSAFGGQTWEIEGRTTDDTRIWFGFGPDGRPNAFELDVKTDCGRLRTWSQGGLVIPFVGQGDRLRAVQKVKDVLNDGAAYDGTWRLEARLTDGAITGSARLDERRSVAGRVTDRCTSGRVAFRIPRD